MGCFKAEEAHSCSFSCLALMLALCLGRLPFHKSSGGPESSDILPVRARPGPPLEVLDSEGHCVSKRPRDPKGCWFVVFHSHLASRSHQGRSGVEIQ